MKFNDRFTSLQFKNSDDKKFVEECLLNRKTDKENFAALFIIIYRFRNNLIHGEKIPYKLFEYSETFEIINIFLAEYISKMQGKIRVDKKEIIVDGNGVEIEG